MKRKDIFVPLIVSVAMLLAACGKSDKAETSLFEPMENTTQQEEAELQSGQNQTVEDKSQVIAEDENQATVEAKDEATGETKDEVTDETKDESTAETKNGEITEDQAYNAVINYCKATNPDFSEEMNSEGYTEYWDVSTNENGEIVVLYRSYTAAQIRYYVNKASGETYITEFVPGITDEEQRTDETFNVRDYLN